MDCDECYGYEAEEDKELSESLSELSFDSDCEIIPSPCKNTGERSIKSPTSKITGRIGRSIQSLRDGCNK